MQWLSQNWIGILLIAAFVGLHLFGHRGHGRHGGSALPDANADGNAPGTPPAPERSRHRH